MSDHPQDRSAADARRRAYEQLARQIHALSHGLHPSVVQTALSIALASSLATQARSDHAHALTLWGLWEELTLSLIAGKCGVAIRDVGHIPPSRRRA